MMVHGCVHVLARVAAVGRGEGRPSKASTRTFLLSSTHITRAAVAALLPLAGVGRRLPHATRLQLAALAQAACYGLSSCAGLFADAKWALAPETYLGVGLVLAAGPALLLSSALLTCCCLPLCGGAARRAALLAADAIFNCAHACAVMGVGACAHLGWDVLLAATRALPGRPAVEQHSSASGAGAVL